MAGRSLSFTIPTRLGVRAGGGVASVTRRTGPPRPGVRPVLALLALLALLAGGWWWLRDAPLVGVTEVSVTGTQGRQAAAIRAALIDAAQDMTTLHVREELLEAAVARYPIVASVRAEGDFPHGLRVTVVEHRPVAALRSGNRAIPVAADGTLLRGADTDGLPSVAVSTPPAGTRLDDPLGWAQVRILAAAPAALRRHVTKTFTGSRGLALQLRDGPEVAFGSPERLAAKWAALAAVLADPASAGGTLIDLGVPERPAVAGLAEIPPAQGTDAGADPAAAGAPAVSDPAAPAVSARPTPTAPVAPAVSSPPTP